jgi:hypothetical protein
MIQSRRCNNIPMTCVDSSSCQYEGVRVPNYEWLKSHTGVVYKCNFYKRVVTAATINSNLFGVAGCTAYKLYCHLHDSIVIWKADVIDRCAFDVLLRTDLELIEDNVLVDWKNHLLFKIIDTASLNCAVANTGSNFVGNISVFHSAEGFYLSQHKFFHSQSVVKGDSLLSSQEFLFAERDFTDRNVYNMSTITFHITCSVKVK